MASTKPAGRLRLSLNCPRARLQTIQMRLGGGIALVREEVVAAAKLDKVGGEDMGARRWDWAKTAMGRKWE